MHAAKVKASAGKSRWSHLQVVSFIRASATLPKKVRPVTLALGQALAWRLLGKCRFFVAENGIDKPARRFDNRKTGHRLKSLFSTK
jgi:hypothetical protein